MNPNELRTPRRERLRAFDQTERLPAVGAVRSQEQGGRGQIVWSSACNENSGIPILLVRTPGKRKQAEHCNGTP